MKYRIFALVGLLAMTAGSILQAQDYDDIYYDASKSTTATAKKSKSVTQSKTAAVYGEVPETYQMAAQDNYRLERDIDEYNRRGAYDPSIVRSFEVDINGDTIYFDNDSIYEESFANTRRIERFYNPDIVILSDDDDLVQLYYDESPTVNLIIGSDWGYGSSYGWGYSSYYPWYTGWYDPWYTGWYDPWYSTWYTPWYYRPWYNRWYYSSYWGSSYWYANHHNWNYWTGWNYAPHRHDPTRFVDTSSRPGSYRTGYAANRNTRGRVDASGNNRSNISSRSGQGNRGSSMGSTSRSRTGYATSRGGNMGSRNSSGITSRNSGSVSRAPSSSGGSRTYNSGSSSRSSGYSGSRSSGSSYSSGSSSRSSSGSYSGGGSRGSGGGGGNSGSSGSSRRH